GVGHRHRPDAAFPPGEPPEEFGEEGLARARVVLPGVFAVEDDRDERPVAEAAVDPRDLSEQIVDRVTGGGAGVGEADPIGEPPVAKEHVDLAGSRADLPGTVDLPKLPSAGKRAEEVLLVG